MSNRFVVMNSSAKVSGKARKFGEYRHVAVVELTAEYAAEGRLPAMISERARGVAQIIWDSGSVSVGKTDRCAYAQALRAASERARHLNLLTAVAEGRVTVTPDLIAGEGNAETQRRLIDAYGGLDRYLADTGATTLASDAYGTLIEAPGGVRVVRVTCPSTSREYALRVPPHMQTAHAAVAWTFGLTPETYAPSAQS